MLCFVSNEMEQPSVVPKDIKILETVDDIQERRTQVLSRYGEFKADAKGKRDKLEDSRRFQVNDFSVFLFEVQYF